jgi:hypothetical protein
MQKDSQVTQLAIRPTRFTLYLRRCLPWQLWRFIIINLRMTVMIIKSHHTRLADGRRARPAPMPAVVKP